MSKSPKCLNNCPVVSQLFTPNKQGWDEAKLSQLFENDSVKAIKQIPIRAGSSSDGWTWIKSSNGSPNC